MDEEEKFVLTCPFPCCGKKFELSEDEALRCVDQVDRELIDQLMARDLEEGKKFEKRKEGLEK